MLTLRKINLILVLEIIDAGSNRTTYETKVYTAFYKYMRDVAVVYNFLFADGEGQDISHMPVNWCLGNVS